MNIFSILNGLSALTVLVLGVVTCTRIIVKYFHERKPLLPFAGLLGLVVGFFYIGPTTTFFSLLFTQTNIPYTAYGLISYSHVPFAIMDAMWLGFSIFNPDHRKLGTSLFAASGVVYYIALFGWSKDMFAPSTPLPHEEILDILPGPEILDIQLASVVEIMVIGYIICVVLILAVNFYTLRPKLTGDTRRWATYLTLGFFLFAIAGILDTVLSGEFIVVARVIMAFSVIYIYRGFYVKA